MDFTAQLPLPAAFHTALSAIKEAADCGSALHGGEPLSGNSKKVIKRTAPKQFEFLSIHAEKLLTELSMQHLCSGMWKLQKESSTLDLRPGRSVSSCRSSSPPQS